MEDPESGQEAVNQTESRDIMAELRAIQLQYVPASVRNAAPSHDQPPTPVSPSDHGIINSVEQDTIDDLAEAPLQSAGGSTSWAHEPDPLLFPDLLVSQHGSASAVDSNVGSLAATTPASGAIDQATDVGMALAEAALTDGLGADFQSNSNVLDTISPSALLTATAPGAGPDDSVLLGAVDSAPESQDHDTVIQEDPDEFGILASEDTATAPNEYIIALPPAARSRAEALEIIRAHHREIDAFKKLFSHDAPGSLDDKAIVKIDAMLQNLDELNNLPPYHKDLPGLSQEEWVRYARDTTSKMAFLYEFINKLRNVDVHVTILGSSLVIEKVEAIVNQGGFSYRHALQQGWSQLSDEQGRSCKVTLVDTSRATDAQPRVEDSIVIAYDETAESSGLLRRWKTNRLENQTPLIFSLVGVYSLEHINRRLSPNMDPLEKRLAQVRCLVGLASYAYGDDDQSAAYEQVPQPHEFAHELIQYMVDENGFHPPPVRWETWDHQRIPEHVFDMYKRARGSMAPYGSRKRARENSFDKSVTPKRARIDSTADDIQLSEELRQRFGDNIQVSRGMAEVSLEKLEGLVDMVSTPMNVLSLDQTS